MKYLLLIGLSGFFMSFPALSSTKGRCEALFHQYSQKTIQTLKKSTFPAQPSREATQVLKELGIGLGAASVVTGGAIFTQGWAIAEAPDMASYIAISSASNLMLLALAGGFFAASIVATPGGDDLKGFFQMSSLFRAIKRNNQEKAKRLIKKIEGRQFLTKNIFENNIFHEAILSNNHKMVSLLLDNVGLINSVNGNGETPLVLAERLGNDDIIGALKHYSERERSKLETTDFLIFE